MAAEISAARPFVSGQRPVRLSLAAESCFPDMRRDARRAVSSLPRFAALFAADLFDDGDFDQPKRG